MLSRLPCGGIDSDLDVAITANLGHYCSLDTDWKNELSKRTGVQRLPATEGFKRPRGTHGSGGKQPDGGKQ
jgi:hypothetical protein